MSVHDINPTVIQQLGGGWRAPRPDPVHAFERLAVRLYTTWVRRTCPFAAFGRRVSIHYSCDFSRAKAGYVSFADDVYIAPDVWLNVVPDAGPPLSPKIVLGKGCKIGRRSTISAKNSIVIGEDVLLAPSVMIMDHNHEYSDPESPIHAQGMTEGGRIVIGRNSWLGHGCVIVCSRGMLTIGENSVVGANAVVTSSVPPRCVVTGSPARVVKRYDPNSRQWVKVEPQP
jgi:acetyltransferase-like isoleucine patch superfamily enzyme